MSTVTGFLVSLFNSLRAILTSAERRMKTPVENETLSTPRMTKSDCVEHGLHLFHRHSDGRCEICEER